MDEPSRSSKKRKASVSANTAATPGPTLQNIEKSSDFWIEDGNMILRTATKQYRIHRGVLAMQSSVFKDMFNVPQPTEQLNVDGVPVVEVTDSAKDWDLLLPVIYGVKSMYIQDALSKVIHVGLVIVMLRLGRKYDFERFKLEALSQLKAFFPDNLQDWDDSFHSSYDTLGEYMSACLFELVWVSLELDIRRVLPVAFYTCLRNVGVERILGKDYDPDILSSETKRRLVLGDKRLLREVGLKSMSWFVEGSPSRTCRSPASCREGIKKVLVRICTAPEIDYALDPPEPISDTVYFGDLCMFCRSEADAMNLKGDNSIREPRFTVNL